MLARLDPTDQGGETHIDSGGVSSRGPGEAFRCSVSMRHSAALIAADG